MRAVAIDGGGLSCVEIDDPTPERGQIVVRVAACGICGSDLHAHQLGMAAGTVLGHEFCGDVVEVGDGVSASMIGDTVVCAPVLACGHCRQCALGDPIRCTSGRLIGFGDVPGAMAELVLASAHLAIPVPSSLPAWAAAVAEPLAVGLNVLHAARATALDTLCVLGGGPVGLAVVMWARLLGIDRVVVGEPVAGRRELATICGATSTVDATEHDALAAIREAIGGSPSVIVEATGRQGVVPQAISLAPRDGRIVVAGLHVEPDVIDLRKAFLKSLQMSFASWYRFADLQHTVERVADGSLPAASFVTDRVALDEVDEAFARLRRPNGEGKILVEPEQAQRGVGS